MMVAFLIVLVLFNVSMWIVFLRKFKSLFSTDEILNQTKNSVNGFLREINSSVVKNIEVIDARIDEMKAVTSEAERRIGILKKELASTEKSEKFQRQIFFQERNDFENLPDEENSVLVEIKNSAPKTEIPFENPGENPEQKIPSAEKSEQPEQIERPERTEQNEIPRTEENSLRQETENEQKNEEPDLREKIHSEENDAKKLPAPEKTERLEYFPSAAKIPDFVVSKNQIEIKKDFKDQVKELFALGLPADEIAQRTGRSIQEVKVVMELF